MNIGGLLSKALPVVKKVGPLCIGAMSGITEAISRQKAETRLVNIEERITELEKLAKKD